VLLTIAWALGPSKGTSRLENRARGHAKLLPGTRADWPIFGRRNRRPHLGGQLILASVGLWTREERTTNEYGYDFGQRGRAARRPTLAGLPAASKSRLASSTRHRPGHPGLDRRSGGERTAGWSRVTATSWARRSTSLTRDLPRGKGRRILGGTCGGTFSAGPTGGHRSVKSGFSVERQQALDALAGRRPTAFVEASGGVG